VLEVLLSVIFGINVLFGGKDGKSSKELEQQLQK
jgi:hypothetical protein